MLKAVLSAALGLTGGGAEYFFLSRIVSAVTSQGKINAVYIILFTILPAAVLLPIAFLAPDNLLLTGSCLAGTLILTAVIKAVRHQKTK